MAVAVRNEGTETGIWISMIIFHSGVDGRYGELVDSFVLTVDVMMAYSPGKSTTRIEDLLRLRKNGKAKKKTGGQSNARSGKKSKRVNRDRK